MDLNVKMIKSSDKFYKTDKQFIFVAKCVEVPTEIVTAFGVSTLQPGDYIVSGFSNESIPFSKELFEKMFKEIPLEEAYDPKNIILKPRFCGCWIDENI